MGDDNSVTFLPHSAEPCADDPMLATLANDVLHRRFEAAKTWPSDPLALYAATMSLFHVGGERWNTWNGTVRDVIVNAQRKEQDCFDGSWDPVPAEGEARPDPGRLETTALTGLALEVYYRYLPLALTK